MIRRQQRLITALLVAADVLATELALFAAFILRFHLPFVPAWHGVPAVGPYLVLGPVVALTWPLVFSLQGLYRPSRTRSTAEELFAVAAAAILATVVLFGTDAYLRVYSQRNLPAAEHFEYSRAFMAMFLGLDIVAVALGRAGARAVLARARAAGFNSKRILIVGAGPLGETVAAKMLEHREYGYSVVGFLDDEGARREDEVAGLPVLGDCGEVLDVVKKHAIDQIYLALPLAAHDRMLAVLRETSREGLEVAVVPDILEHLVLRAGIEDLDGVPIINLGEDPMGGLGGATKRAFDVALSAGLLLVGSPFLGLIAALIKLGSPGPVLFRQIRMGLDGKPFTILKFRTMLSDAEAGSGPVFATADDARTTGLGRWLRRLGADEVPQLWNVLRGDMSLVGPRPERPEFVAEFKQHVPQYMYRHRVKAGITGWAQVHGWRGNTSIPRRIEHDLYYIQNWSLGLDLKILWLTLRHGIWHENAY